MQSLYIVAKRHLTGKNNNSLLQTQNDSGLFNIYFQDRQWICFLRMQDGLISKSAWNTRNIRRGRFAFVDIANGRVWGNPRLLSLSHSLAVQKQC